MLIGILALQGDFAEHANMLSRCGADTVLVKHGHQLDALDGLVIPGGESTTIAKLTATLPSKVAARDGDSASGNDIFDRILDRAKSGMPIYGTCMGTIFLAREIEGSTQGRLALMNITVRRNAFGPQKFSREESVSIPALGSEPFPLVFIRGPIITAASSGVEVLASVSEGIVMARQDNLLATAFHPELTDDLRVHRYFTEMVRDYKSQPPRLNPAPALALKQFQPLRVLDA
jgi:5'-phosphate synthase pdxT subunit